MKVAQSLLGLTLLTAIPWLLSEKRSHVSLRLIAVGLTIQLSVAGILFHFPVVNDLFLKLNYLVLALQEATKAGTSFVFGYLGGAPLPFSESFPGGSFIFAFQALPLILVMSALSSLLFYWRILPLLVQGIARLLQKSMGIGGALGLGVSANIFAGMIEAPLLIRPYLNQLHRSELFALMTTGMATVAGTVLALYASILGSLIPDALGHLIAASVISAPAALSIALVMSPPAKPTLSATWNPPSDGPRSSMDAITQGTTD
ncbi:MAG: nucleoside:proton symporter, partial [Magnetococcales bacterium]|nr:nucleoside:proton symporter [Magnetococcales bacterium]